LGIEIYDSDFPGFSLIPAFLRMKGAVYFKQEEVDKAETYLEKSVQMCDKTGFENYKYYPLVFLSHLHARENRYQKAYNTYRKAIKIKEKTRRKESMRMAKIAETSANVRLLNEEIKNLVQNNQKSKIIFILIIAILLLMSTTVFLIFRQKHIDRQQRISNQNRELQTLLAGLTEKRMTLNKGVHGVSSPREIITCNKENLKETFEAAFRENIQNFSENFPTLTHSEIIYAVMFALHYSNDTIARIQNIQLSTIRKIKQRIRKKLELKNDANLEILFEKYTNGVISENLQYPN